MPLTAPPAQVAAAFSKLQLPTDPEQRNQTLYDFVMKVGAACSLGSALAFGRRVGST
jgi:hypothetical protein